MTKLVFKVFVDRGIPASNSDTAQVIRNSVSPRQRDRIFNATLYANERRLLVTDFNGAIAKSQRIVTTVWHTHEPNICAMSSAEVNERRVGVQIAAQYSGICRIRVDATLDSGEVYSAWHAITVMPAPVYNNAGWTNGPSRLEARLY